MHFLTIASALFAAALAAPAPQSTGSSASSSRSYENINISSFSLRKNPSIQNAGFKLSGNNATNLACEIGAVPNLPSEVVICGTSDYRFGLVQGNDTEYGLAVYHQTGAFAGMYAIADVPTHCRAGGDGPEDFVCEQANALTIRIAGQ
ncbi:hypothetical protein EJ07DRAFT_170514 [Lizonia empirigonia]|nr:hypothetical protein EJ07DRAFT_170514 [Lizonia empirigonia]